MQPTKEQLYQWYVVEKKTYRKIMELIGTKNNRKIRKLLEANGIDIRHGSEAVKTQWIDNDERKKRTGDLLKKNTSEGTPGREKLKKIMKTEAYRNKSSLSKVGEKNPMYGVTRENNPLWNSDISEEDRIKSRKTIEYARWKRAVKERDDNICQKCLSAGNVAHHMNSYTKYPDERYDVDNGVTLCEPCHIKYHSVAGMSSTKEKTIAFLND